MEAITEIALSLRSRELNSALLPLPSHSIIVAYFLLLLERLGNRERKRERETTTVVR